MASLPDPVPNVQQLLAFYLEAGVDCALAEEPVDHLADPDAAPPGREAAPVQPVRTIAAMLPTARIEAAPAPEAAIALARETARTAPTLEALRGLLEKFDGCALSTPPRASYLPTAIRTRASCSSARLRGARKTSKACPSWDGRANCWTG